MLSRKNRYSFKKGLPKSFFATPYFVIRYEENKEGLKCSVVVGKKVDKRAVIRNKIKRQIVVQIKDILPTSLPFSIVLYARKPVLSITTDTIKQELESVFTKLNIL